MVRKLLEPTYEIPAGIRRQGNRRKTNLTCRNRPNHDNLGRQQIRVSVFFAYDAFDLLISTRFIFDEGEVGFG